MKLPPLTHFGASFSACARYRWRLWRTWDETKPVMVWLMLNPSTATGTEDDPTIRRCQRFAHLHGYGGVIILNLFALVSTDPKALRTTEDPIGPENDVHLATAMHTKNGLLVAGWGAEPFAARRGMAVSKIAERCGRTLQCFGVTKGGAPRHPLYLPYTATLEAW